MTIEERLEALEAQQIADARTIQALEMRVESLERDLARFRRMRLERLGRAGGGSEALLRDVLGR